MPTRAYSNDQPNTMVLSSSALNCKQFDGNCRWSNTNDDELDWGVRISTLEAEKWIPKLETEVQPGINIA